MTTELTYTIRTIPFDEDYHPADGTRATTNFANLARGPRRQENLRNAFAMIDRRFNALADWDNPDADRYKVELEIVTAEIAIGTTAFPLIEILKPTILDGETGKRIPGIAGNNFSSYVRDYDFSILLPQHNAGRDEFALPQDFGRLHGNLFRRFLGSSAYRTAFAKPPGICLSVSSSRTYHQTANSHPVLGVEYSQNAQSATDLYFGEMGLRARYFMPRGAVAPLAFYAGGDLLNDYSSLELIGTIGTMETFQRIYRPEIYNANAAAGLCFRPGLTHQDYSLTRVEYDREERSRLAVQQGKLAEEKLIKPYGPILEVWSASHAA